MPLHRVLEIRWKVHVLMHIGVEEEEEEEIKCIFEMELHALEVLFL